jgi:hypothetical protein
MLGILIERAKQDGQVCRLLPHLVEGGVSIVQHADDTILLMEHDLDKDFTHGTRATFGSQD